MKEYKFTVEFEVEDECECENEYDFIDCLTLTLQEIKGVKMNVKVIGIE